MFVSKLMEGKSMTVNNRIFMCRLIEKIERNEKCARQIGVTNSSTFKGKRASYTPKKIKK